MIDLQYSTVYLPKQYRRITTTDEPPLSGIKTRCSWAPRSISDAFVTHPWTVYHPNNTVEHHFGTTVLWSIFIGHHFGTGRDTDMRGRMYFVLFRGYCHGHGYWGHGGLLRVYINYSGHAYLLSSWELLSQHPSLSLIPITNTMSIHCSVHLTLILIREINLKVRLNL